MSQVENPAFDRDLRKAIKENRTRLSPDWNWSAYNSSLARYEIELFGDNHGEPLRKLIADIQDPVVLDLMAPSGTLAELFDKIPNQHRLGIAVSLQDLRGDKEKTRDKALGITQIAGDLSSPSTWRLIDRAFNGRRANLIIEAADQGARTLPHHHKFFAYAFKKMWSILDEQNGQMILSYLRIPLRESGILFDSMVFEPLVNIGIDVSRIHYGVLHIKRKPEDPAELPIYLL